MTARGYELDEAVRELAEKLRRVDLKYARMRPASGVSFTDDGGSFGGGDITLQQIINLIAAGTAPDVYLLNTLGGKDKIQDLGTLGATATTDMANASVFLGELAEDCTISTTGWTSGRRCTIGVSLTEDGTGTWTPTFSGVTWIGGTPTWDTTASTVTHVLLFSDDGGTTIYGAVVGSGGSSFALTIEDEGTPLATAADTLDFVGAGVTASGTGATKTITIPGVSGGPGDPGADVVLVATGAGSVLIPGMSGSPDAVPGSPDAFDDEFDALSGWTTLGSLDSLNVTDAASHLHLKKASTGVQYNGIYKTAPSMPFTVTLEVSDFALDTQYQSCGILLTEASPGKLASFDLAIAGGSWYLALRRWTNRTTFASSVDLAISNLVLGAHLVRYLRLVVASSTDITCQWSARGHVWNSHATLSNLDPSLTIANVGIGLGVPVSSSVTCDLFADWVRFE